jgi:hypothetical protein
VSLSRNRRHLEEGRSAGAQSGRKRIRGSGKTANFKPATFHGFRNVAETYSRKQSHFWRWHWLIPEPNAVIKIDMESNIGLDFCPKLAAYTSVFSGGWTSVRQADSQFLSGLHDVFVTASGQIYDDDRILGHGGCTLDGSRYGMGALQGRDNPLHLG